MTTTRFAVIDTNTGFVWYVGDAASPEAACAQATQETTGERHEYAKVSPREAGDGYLVYAAPAGFEVDDGQHASEIERVEALPLVGRFHELPPQMCQSGDWSGVHCSREAEFEVAYVPEHLRGTADAAGSSRGLLTTLHVCAECAAEMLADEEMRAEASDATRLRVWLDDRSISQRELARQLGVADRTVRYWCSGEQPVPTMAWLALKAL